MGNPYLPMPMRLEKNFIETEDKNIRTFTLSFINKEDEQNFKYLPGQFAEVFAFGKGESPFGIASSPTEPGILKFSVMKVGKVTTALHQTPEGAVIGVRGPLGNSYPMEELKGKNLVVIGGGFAFTTLRSTITYILDPKNRGDYGNLTVIYGARNSGLLLYKEELAQWEKRSDITMVATVDRGDENWKGKVGFVPAMTKETAPSAENTYAVVCGPPIMIKFTLPVLEELGFPPERIIMALENRMKCGIGMCGRCNVGNKFVCKDGPVFTLAQLKTMPNEY
ncbi:FAD/NAD(P)-binding protein [Pelotomaculum propionicicum]|uniref:Anaerobic sulfite reductase subunit B n=1 Tax=Pelotomaculum propionicicum TaxID=258475 RepID=A0A4Y7RJ81_9FIRM|nr:FAD/NAD(P)-binding protein [Pelotomaculum propionicicum]TEB08800.1 Anaerobic sulfite reductase subunit B [Pelotomaculum propionicicum]